MSVEMSPRPSGRPRRGPLSRDRGSDGIPTRTKSLKIADYHCGVGSLRLAFEGIADCVWSFTPDEQAGRCHRENFGDRMSRTVADVPAHDILLANLDECRAAWNPRSSGRHPFDTILDIACLRRPSSCVLAGSSAAAHGEAVRRMIDELVRAGYFVQRAALDAVRFGLPQARKTDFVVAFDRKTGFRFPTGRGRTGGFDRLLDPSPAACCYISDALREKLIARRARGLTGGRQWRLGFVDGRANELRDAPDAPFDNIRIEPDGRWRVLTEREAARAQGIPDGFVLHRDGRTARRQIARCIPVPPASAVAERVVAALLPGDDPPKAGAPARRVRSGALRRKPSGSQPRRGPRAGHASASPLRWYGSLNRFAGRIVGLFPKHECYCEVFGGSAAILLSKPPSEIECYNDIDARLVNFWRALREPGMRKRLVAMLEMTPFARAVFRACVADRDDTGDPVKRAWSFVVACNQSRNGEPGWQSQWSYNRRGGKNARAWANLPPRLAEVGRRLKHVQVEDLPFEDCLRRYDSRGTLFLLDPPYLLETRSHSGRYTHECGREDHIRLLRIARGLKAKVAACAHRSDLYDEMLHDWRRTDFRCGNIAGSGAEGRKVSHRVLSVYTNYDPPSRPSA